MNVEDKLKEILLPILGIESIDEIESDSALVNDLGAESIDFVEILYMIETELGVKVQAEEIIMTRYGQTDSIEEEGVISKEIAEMLNRDFKTDRFKEGQTVRELFENFTVGNFAQIIEEKLKEQKE